MAPPSVDPFTVAGSYNSLIHRIVDRDPAALAELHRLLGGPLLRRVRARTGDVDAAVAITQAAFVEMWRLAPARRRFDDARGWLFTIADRRISEHLRSRAWPATLGAGYDEHMGLELRALLRCDPSDDADAGELVPWVSAGRRALTELSAHGAARSDLQRGPRCSMWMPPAGPTVTV